MPTLEVPRWNYCKAAVPRQDLKPATGASFLPSLDRDRESSVKPEGRAILAEFSGQATGGFVSVQGQH